MNLWDADALAKQLIKQHKLSRWSFGFNRRKKTLGLCNYNTKRIELSSHFVRDNDELAIRDTLLHEIAHAIAGPNAGHGIAWKKICLQIGASPQRTDNKALMPKGNWVATCPSCKQEHTRHRKPLKGRTYYCKKCGSQNGQLSFTRKNAAIY